MLSSSNVQVPMTITSKLIMVWGAPVLILFSILVNFRGAPVLMLKLFSLLVNFREAPVKKNTL